MGLRFSEPPPQALQVLMEGLRLKEGAPLIRGLEVRGDERVDVAAPHMLYTVDLDELIEHRSLTTARPAAWRYLIVKDDTLVGSAELATGKDKYSAERLASTSQSPFDEETNIVLAVASALPEVERGSFEVGVLRIPAIYVMALWLRDQEGTANLFIPMKPAPSPLEAHVPYPEKRFVSILIDLARPQLEFDSSPGQAEPPIV